MMDILSDRTEDPQNIQQPYRTTPLVLPHARTIHDVASPADTNCRSADVGQPFRNSSILMPGPRTINDLRPGAGAPAYQPPRGPQYNSSPTPPTKPQQSLYNSPAPLYSEEAMEEAALQHPGYVQAR